MWEDLCQLEGRLGMRYLTHESEDNFWTKHGAKPHPLAKAEAEHRLQTAIRQQQTFEDLSPTLNSRVKFENGGPISNGTTLPQGLTVEQVASSVQNRSKSSESLTSDNQDRSSTSSKHYSEMTDDDIKKSQAHAMRVGYKVSTV